MGNKGKDSELLKTYLVNYSDNMFAKYSTQLVLYYIFSCILY